MLMENMLFEGYFYKTNSASTYLHIITLRLHENDIRDDIIVYVIHVVGTLMKELGINNLSRGDLLEGVMSRKDPLEILPMDIGALDRVFEIEKRIRDWWGFKPLIKLYNVGWFTQRNG